MDKSKVVFYMTHDLVILNETGIVQRQEVIAIFTVGGA